MSRAVVLRGGRAGLGGEISDLRIEDGCVVAVGPAAARDAECEILQLPDSTVLPGIVDGHVHADQWAHRSRRIDVSAARRPSEVIDLVQVALAASPELADDGQVVTAHGFVDGLWAEPPHRQLLDYAFGRLPVAAVSMDLHALWLSSSALAAVGHSDHPTGVLREQDSIETLRLLMEAVPAEVVDRWVVDATVEAARRGVTALLDFEFADNVARWRRRMTNHKVGVRVHASIWLPWLDSAIAAGLRTGDVVDGTGDLLQVGPFKLMSDGSLNTRTAHCHDPYPNAASADEVYGLELIPYDELVELMGRAWDVGLEPAVHAIGDRANTQVLDAFEKVGCPGRVEHAQLVRPQDLSRFSLPGLVASVQPQHAVADRDVADRHWRGRTGSAFPYAQLHAAGARLEFGSDAPVSPLNPWLAIADAVSRTDDDRPPWHPEQALPLDVAVAASCGGKSSIQVGARADLTVVPGDLRDLSPNDLRATTVLATLVGGRFTHRAETVGPAGVGP